MVTALTTILTVLVCLVGVITRVLFSRSGITFSEAPIVGVITAPGAVMAYWSMMALRRRWRSEVDWVGWLGRALAVGWFLTVLAAAVVL